MRENFFRRFWPVLITLEKPTEPGNTTAKVTLLGTRCRCSEARTMRKFLAAEATLYRLHTLTGALLRAISEELAQFFSKSRRIRLGTPGSVHMPQEGAPI